MQKQLEDYSKLFYQKDISAKQLVASLYKSASLSVSEFVFVCLFPNFSETANPSELKFWGMIPLGMQNVLG